jgi:hypothetical protein
MPTKSLDERKLELTVKKSHWENNFKGLNYLMVAHGGALIAIFAIAKNDKVPTEAHFPIFVACVGLACAILAYVCASDLYVRRLEKASGVAEPGGMIPEGLARWSAMVFSGLSVALLFILLGSAAHAFWPF